MLMLMIFCLSPLTLLAQRLVITPADVTVEKGGAADFMVVLSSAPTGDVTVTIVRQNVTDLIGLDKTVLMFTPTNWSVPQKVTVTAGEDADFEDDADRLILIASGGGYGGSGGVTVSPDIVAVGSLGETVQLTAVVRDQDGTPVTGVDLEWSSVDPSVAVVDSVGNVTSVNYGLTMITATLATVSGTAIILVEDPNNSSASDRYILELLFKATKGEDWSWKEGWLTDAPLDQWYGVTTDAGGHVTKLWLAYNNLRGTLPSLLGRLRNLEELALYNNRLTGPIPPELGNLTQLKEISLSHNELSGSIPPELGNLTQLKELILAGNELSGPIPPELSNLTQLELLWLFENRLSGPIPPELGNLMQLTELILGTNSLSGSIPPELGNLTQLTDLLLDRNELSGPIPPELSNLTQLGYLWMFENRLSGPIPPELGNLMQLTELILDANSLSGSIPPELGNLTQLSKLFLDDNPDLKGLLPRSFIGLGLEALSVEDTGVCRQQDVVFLQWWRNIPNREVDYCAPSQIERLALIELYDKMNGTSWTNAAGWGDNGPLGDWFGVTVGNGRVTELSLPNNALKDSIPGEIVNFTELEVLNLANNSLAGALPGEISFLRELTTLRINGNADLGGILGRDLTKLAKLEVLHFGGTLICASPAPTFQTWYVGIGDVSGMLCNNPTEIRLSVPAAYLTQSVQTPESSVRLVEGRDALLRVFVTGDRDPAFFEHKVVATVRGGGRTHQVEMTRAEDRLAVEVDESDLANSFNAVIRGDFITPGATLVVEADPDGVIPRAVGSQDRFPATGEASLKVISIPDMEVTVVPVLEANQPDTSIFAWTDNIGDDSPEVGLFRYAFPFNKFHARSREAYATSLDLVSDDGQWGLVLELEALRMLDNATGYYYGAAASVNGYVRGRARLGGWTSMGKAWDTELAHEVGHNLNLEHAPCGGALGTDPDFPYPDGSVGISGFDFRDSTLISPAYHKDIMGYCYEQGWLSDYFFEKVIDYREQVEGKRGPPLADAAHESDMLVLWGGVQGGELRIEPPFSATASARLPEADGPYRLEGLGGDVILFSLSFTPGQDKFGDKYFFFAIPVEQDWEESLDRIVLTGPEGSVAIGADEQRTLSVFRDARTGKVRGILRDWDGNLPVALQQADDLSIMTIQGLMDSVRQRR